MAPISESPRSGRRFRKAAGWIAFAAVLIVEFLMADAWLARHYARIYPRWNDQIQYLGEAYTGYDYAREHGLAQGLWHAATKPSAQGMLYAPAAVLVFELAGPSRSAALALNLLAWIALQGAFFWAASRVLGSRILAWSAVGLLLCWSTPWSGGPGSACDFRLDLMAACAYGVTLALAQATDGFRSTRGSLLFGVAVGLTLLLRFLTGVYFAVIFVGLLGWVLLLPGRMRRALNLMAAVAMAAALAGPVIWLNRSWIWEYYGIGHFTGPERAIRDSHLGIADSFAFIGRSLEEHLGGWFLWGALGVTIILGTGALLARLFGRRPEGSAAALGPWMVPAACFTAVPALVLASHNQKSPVVISILVPGATALIVGLWRWLARGWRPVIPNTAVPWTGTVLSCAAVAYGACSFLARQRVAPNSVEFMRDVGKVNALADLIFNAATEHGLAGLRIGVDQITDCLDAQVLRIVCYERHHVWLPLEMTLPTGIMREREPLLMERVTQSDFVFLAVGDLPAGFYPYDEEMRALRPRSLAWCDANLRRIDRFPLFGRTWALYGRAGLTAGGVDETARKPALAR